MLTDTAIKRAQPKGKPYRLTEGRGFYLIVNPNGTKYWRLDYTIGGRRNSLSLGRPYPDTPLALARERCNEARRQIAAGIDPLVRPVFRRRLAHSF
jgi:hypothetical protein